MPLLDAILGFSYRSRKGGGEGGDCVDYLGDKLLLIFRQSFEGFKAAIFNTPIPISYSFAPLLSKGEANKK